MLYGLENIHITFTKDAKNAVILGHPSAMLHGKHYISDALFVDVVETLIFGKNAVR